VDDRAFRFIGFNVNNLGISLLNIAWNMNSTTVLYYDQGFGIQDVVQYFGLGLEHIYIR